MQYLMSCRTFRGHTAEGIVKELVTRDQLFDTRDRVREYPDGRVVVMSPHDSDGFVDRVVEYYPVSYPYWSDDQRRLIEYLRRREELRAAATAAVARGGDVADAALRVIEALRARVRPAAADLELIG